MPEVVKDAALAAPVEYIPVVFAMNDVPTVSNAELTLVDTLAAPVTTNATPGAVLLIPTLLLTESTNNTPESKLELPAIDFATKSNQPSYP